MICVRVHRVVCSCFVLRPAFGYNPMRWRCSRVTWTSFRTVLMWNVVSGATKLVRFPIHCAQGRPCHTATRLSGCRCDWWFAFYYILLIYIGAVGAYNDTTRFDDVSYSLCQLNCQCVMYIKQSIHHFFMNIRFHHIWVYPIWYISYNNNMYYNFDAIFESPNFRSSWRSVYSLKTNCGQIT